jgi:NADH-quinone oxidoreductase subunit J
MELFIFVVAAAIILTGAVGVIISGNPVHSALCLVATLFGIAVLFVAEDAHFLAAVQVIVYAGAIVVLFLFVIMLLGVDKVEDLRVEPFKLQRKFAGIVGGGVIGLVTVAAISSRDNIGLVKPVPSDAVATAEALGAHDSNIRRLARDLFTDHVLAFELTSVLLVIAVVGTVILARRAPQSSSETPS